jgi:predicted RNA methylase
MAGGDDMTATAFSPLLEAVQNADEDFEWYPTTDRMIAVVARHIPTDAKSIMDIGAGDGRVLVALGKKCTDALLYAIEKSNVLIQAQPENVIPVGTDLFEQNLAFLPVDIIFANPPYSQFADWASVIIEAGHAKKAFLVIPRRWKESEKIAIALKRRGATARVIHSDDFLDADRRARAVVDIVEVSYPLKEPYGYRSGEVKDPFDIWFDENISTFDAEVDDDSTEYDRNQRGLARLRHLDTVTGMVEAYNEEYERMQENYRAIFRLDYALLKELGVSKNAVRDGIKAKMAGLKTKYWTLLFERLDAITNRLSTKTREKFLEKLTGRVALAFTANNAYAVVLWAIKNANKYFDEQTVQLFRELSTFDGAENYKSNQRTWEKNQWRYYHHDDETRPTRYSLDYRIVVERHGGIYANSDFGRYDYPGNLHKRSHEIIDDIRAVLYNLGFQAYGPSSRDRQWLGGSWENWTRADGPVLFQVKAYMNGNVHLRFLPDAIKALNVEAGRLLGWLRSPKDVESELGYTPDEAKRFYASTKLIAPSNIRLLAEGTGA